MKWIRFFRHSQKQGEFISQEGLKLIESKRNLFSDSVTTFFTSSYVRTIQTAAHIAVVMGKKTMNLHQLSSINNEKVEKLILENTTMMEDYRKNPSQNIYDLMYKHFSLEDLAVMEIECAKVVREIFEKMKDGESVIAIGHNPFIKMAYNGLVELGEIKGKRCHENMAEMDYIDFIN